jgi:hypothetical protein
MSLKFLEQTGYDDYTHREDKTSQFHQQRRRIETATIFDSQNKIVD